MAHCNRPYRDLLARGLLYLGLLLALTSPSRVGAQTVLQESLLDGNTSAEIGLQADQVASWNNDGLQILLLRGGAQVRQGDVTITATNVVVWVDRQRMETEQATYLMIYGERPLQIDKGSSRKTAGYGYLRMKSTSGSIKLTSNKSKLSETQHADDPAYQNAVTNLPGDWAQAGGAAKAPALARTLPRGPGVEVPTPANASVAPAAELAGPGPVSPAPVNDEVRIPTYTPPQPASTTSYQIPPAPPIAGPQAAGPVGAPYVGPVPAADISALPSPPSRASSNLQLSVRPRYKGDLEVQYKPLPDGRTAVVVSGGVNVLVTNIGEKGGYLDMEADRMVIWTRSNGQQLYTNLRSPAGDTSGANEIFLSGHVEIRARTKTERETLRADEVYYDVRRYVAVARNADFELWTPKVPYPIHVVSLEYVQENAKLSTMAKSKIFSSLLPSDPGLTMELSNTRIEEREYIRRQFFGLFPSYDKEGKPKVVTDHIFTGTNMIDKLEGWPVFYFPWLRARVEDPLGPLEGLNFSYNKIFGFQLYSTFDLFDLLDLDHPEGQRWRLNLDYLSARGPALGTEHELATDEIFGVKTKFTSLFRAYGIYDRGDDVLGGGRGTETFYPTYKNPIPIEHPRERGWISGKFNAQDLPDGFSVMGQFAFISDRNFLEQFFPNIFLNELNQDTYLRVKQQEDNWAWTLYGQARTRDWLTETAWAPKADGYLIGQTFLDDWFVYNAHAGAGYAMLRPTVQAPFAYLPTDVRTNTARLDLMQEVSAPMNLGPIKIAPYAVGDLAYYSSNTNGQSLGRAYGGLGVRWSVPFSRLFPDVQSDLFNLDGLYHKVSLTGNYLFASSTTSLNNVPQLDRLNDDATDQALRDIRPFQPLFIPNSATFLTTSNLFNPQYYALRRLLDNSPDTLDSIDVLQLGINQRLQTKRGFPGEEHVIDWMTLNVGVSLFPQSSRDNFGHLFGILEYDWKWNIGDRTGLTSTGWFEPFEGGPRMFDFGAYFNRPDLTNFYLGYRQIDPVQSKAVVASVTYPFSAKYAMTASTVWDFGTNVKSYSLMVARMGTDVVVGMGLSYNSTLNTFSFAFEITPNLARRPGTPLGSLFPIAQQVTPGGSIVPGRQ